jgi:flagellar assembly protein FliH
LSSGNSSDNNRIVRKDVQFGERFVLPIEQSKVTQSEAKVKQILAETDEKAQQIVDAAGNKSSIIVQTASNEATRIIEDSRKKAQNEYDIIKQQAYDEGFQKGHEDGLKQFQEDAEAGLKALETLASSTFDMKKNIIDSASRDIVELVSAIADKVCHQKLNPQVLYQITLDAIKLLNDKENITIIVSPKLVDQVQKMVPTFKTSVHNLQTVKIVEDSSLSPDGVIVETPSARLDSRISSQIGELAQKMLTGGSDGMGQK